jgi:hypothetical protein
LLPARYSIWAGATERQGKLVTLGGTVTVTLVDGRSRQVLSLPREQADEVVAAFWRQVDGR